MRISLLPRLLLAGFLALGASGPAAAEWRTVDGRGNNPDFPERGAAGVQFLRLVPAAYADGVSAPAGADRPSAREVSNAVAPQRGPMPNAAGATDFFWLWGQFLDHDITLTGTADPSEPFPIAVPPGDLFFDPDITRTATIGLERSAYAHAAGPRQQVNSVTAFIDASNVYGSNAERAAALRRRRTGRLRTSRHRLLPHNTAGFPNAGGPSKRLFLAGDVRANEQVALTAMHILFVREHNRLARRIRKADRSLSPDEIYERARALVGAEMQVITYREFLPVLLGPGALGPYRGYDPTVDPGIANVFATAAYRFGHSMIPETLARIRRNGKRRHGLPLLEMFFVPQLLRKAGLMEEMMRGCATQVAQEIDPRVVDDVRNFLFGAPGAGGFDLVALNIQRGRDHGLPSYNETRAALGLAPATSFADVTADANVRERLASVYGSVDRLDGWVGGLAEDHVPGALVGELFFTIIRDQFERLRTGDRFWYQRTFAGETLAELEATTLAGVIRRNTRIGRRLPDDVFRR